MVYNIELKIFQIYEGNHLYNILDQGGAMVVVELEREDDATTNLIRYGVLPFYFRYAIKQQLVLLRTVFLVLSQFGFDPH